MRRPLVTSALAVAALTTSLLAWPVPSAAARTQDEVRQIAAKLASDLALACPHKPGASSEEAAYQACATNMAAITGIPFAQAVLWGGDQANLRVKDRKLTRFNIDTFRRIYAPMMAFTGKFTVDRDERDKLDIIRVEAYFRNAMPAGNYPYPFWHSDTTWLSFEAMNVMNFYLNDKGQIIIMSRSAVGNEANRGGYAHVTPPVFVKDQWMWADAAGKLQPSVTLFSARYRAGNPSLARLDETYRAFADTMREATCMGCHNPKNPPGMARLVLFQTPVHAAGEIEHVIKSIQGNTMPVNELGLTEDMDPKLRESMLAAAVAFRDEVVAANKWEAAQRAAAVPPGPSPTPR